MNRSIYFNEYALNISQVKIRTINPLYIIILKADKISL